MEMEPGKAAHVAYLLLIFLSGVSPNRVTTYSCVNVLKA